MSGEANLEWTVDLNEGATGHVNFADTDEGHVRSIRKCGGVVNISYFLTP